MENQLDMLIDSLDSKIQLLKDIQTYNKKQEEVFMSDEVDMDNFDDAIEEKEALIKRLNQLEDGLKSIHEKASEELKSNEENYKDQIKIIQQKIIFLTEMSVTITAQEKRNKALVEEYFVKQKQKIFNAKRNSKATFEYYQKSNPIFYAEPQYYDNKK